MSEVTASVPNRAYRTSPASRGPKPGTGTGRRCYLRMIRTFHHIICGRTSVPANWQNSRIVMVDYTAHKRRMIKRALTLTWQNSARIASQIHKFTDKRFMYYTESREVNYFGGMGARRWACRQGVGNSRWHTIRVAYACRVTHNCNKNAQMLLTSI